MDRPIFRFSIIIFGTAAVYTLVNSVVPAFGWPYGGLNIPILLACLVLMVVLAFLLEDGNSNNHGSSHE